MLTRLALKNLTVFSEADFEFAPGLNVIVGENGAGTILQLGMSGIQVFVATHNLLLMRELDLLLKHDEFREVRSRFFGLHPTGDGVAFQQGNSIDDVGTFDALQEELNQSDRCMDVVIP